MLHLHAKFHCSVAPKNDVNLLWIATVYQQIHVVKWLLTQPETCLRLCDDNTSPHILELVDRSIWHFAHVARLIRREMQARERWTPARAAFLVACVQCITVR